MFNDALDTFYFIYGYVVLGHMDVFVTEGCNCSQ